MAIQKLTVAALQDGTITSDAIAEDSIDISKLSNVNLNIAPEVLEIQVSSPTAGQNIPWLWTWEQSTLPYARRTITNSPEISVPLYKQGTYTVNNYAAYELFDQMTQTHTLYLKWIDGAGTDNLISWAVDNPGNPINDSHPDINSGLTTQVQRINVNVPATITLPTLTAPSVSYTVTNNGAGAYTFSGAANGDNPNIGPFYRGGTYTININAVGHPFYFTTDNGTNFASGTYFGEYTTGVTGSRTDNGTITFTVPNDAPSTLYYQCGNHSPMRGAITVKDLAVETNINGNYVVYFQHHQEGMKTPVELRPIPALVNQMCLVYDATSGQFVPQDLATYVENTPSFENKIREVAGTAELVVEDGSAVIAKVNVYDDSTYLPLVGNNPGDQAFATDTDILYIWDGSAWQQAGAANTDDLAEGTTNLFYTDARVGTYLSSNGYDTATNIVASITDSAPATLDTLNELAAALGDDPNFATTTANNIATKWTQDNTKISNWDTAYGWGDHSTQGYITSANGGLNLDGDINLNGKLNLGVLASDPSGVAGDMYYNSTDNIIRYHNGTEWISLEDLGPKLVEFKIWGAGGGSGSQQRTNNAYHTTSYYAVKTGGAGGFVTCSFDIIPGTTLTLSVGGPGRGGLQQGNPSSASGGFNGGGNSTYSVNDAGGGGGGYSGVFLGGTKNQSNALAIAPGGGGGGGGPGYPSNTNDQANGGGGIASAEGTGNAGARNYGYFNANAGGGTPTSGGVGGDASVSNGDGNIGAVLTGANANYYGNNWGSGGGGGGGWYGGGSGANDGDSWSGGGGGAGSAFVRGSGITYNSDGILSLEGVIYRTHTYAIETYGSDDSTYNGMRVPALLATSDPQYPGGNVGYGGDFNTSPPSGLDGYGGAIAYRIGGSGNWTVLTQIGDISITV